MIAKLEMIRLNRMKAVFKKNQACGSVEVKHIYQLKRRISKMGLAVAEVS